MSVVATSAVASPPLPQSGNFPRSCTSAVSVDVNHYWRITPARLLSSSTTAHRASPLISTYSILARPLRVPSAPIQSGHSGVHTISIIVATREMPRQDSENSFTGRLRRGVYSSTHHPLHMESECEGSRCASSPSRLDCLLDRPVEIVPPRIFSL
jgi:hypothetical protein